MGKSSLILVLGFSLVVIMVGPNLAREANRAYENYLNYANITNVHNIAVSAASIAASKIFFDSSWSTGYSNVSFGNGSYDIIIQNLANNRKKLIAYGHLNNAMSYNRLFGNRLQTINDTVEVLIQPSNFSKFAVYLNSMGGVSWFTGDTVYGMCHVEGTMNVLGTPVFYGKVTTKNGTNPATLPSGTTNPKFYGGLQKGVSIPLPTNINQFTSAATSGGKVFNPPASGSGAYQVNFIFNANGTVQYQEYKGATKVKDSTVALTSLAPNGAILVNSGNITVKGTYSGRVSIGTAGTGGGNVQIVGDVVAANDPRTNPNSTDMLGIIADNSVTLPILSPVKHDYLIEASIFCRAGTFSADLNNTMGKQGAVTVYGSLQTNTVGAFSNGNGTTISNGYQNHFTFDNRLLVDAPPAYPNTNHFEVLSWKE